MKYYVVSDVHGYFSLMKQALQEKGFFDDKEPHKLILCGDMLDRGEEALEMQEFMLDLLHKDELIFVRGNHEDLMIEMLNRFEDYRWEISLGASHHNSNGTWAWINPNGHSQPQINLPKRMPYRSMIPNI